jgi:hypothetical protein
MQLVYFGEDPFATPTRHTAQALYQADGIFLMVQIVDHRSTTVQEAVWPGIEAQRPTEPSESRFGYSKMVQRKGMLAREAYVEEAGQYRIQFILKEVYGITVKTDAGDANTIWDYIDTLKLNHLHL